jgi:hypothetical protein
MNGPAGRIALIALALAAPPAYGYFEETAVGARTIALGGSAAAMADDASAAYWNPAGLAYLGGAGLLFDTSRPYGIADLGTSAVIFAMPVGGMGIAAGWHHLGIADTYAEDQFTLAAGRELWTREGHRIAAGTTFKFGRVSFQPFTDRASGDRVNFGSLSKGSLDLGAQWRSPERFSAVWVLRDVLQPDYEFVPGSGGGKVHARNEVSAIYRWNRESTVSLGWREIDGAGLTALDAGLEIWFYDVFAIRSGFRNLAVITDAFGSPNELSFTGGFGVREKRWEIDAVATTQRDLGASYRASLHVPLNAGRTR